MPFTVDDQPFGSLSVTLADNDATLAASIMATAPATLSLSVYGAAPGVPLGGTTGSVLKKNSNADWDTVWGTDLASAAWGTITGTLSSQTDLQTALDLKAPLASPALTGVPTAPTAATLTSTTQLATTAFVQQELAAYGNGLSERPTLVALNKVELLLEEELEEKLKLASDHCGQPVLGISAASAINLQQLLSATWRELGI